MTEEDPLAAWRSNPFFVLEVSIAASRLEIERAGQRLLALLAVGAADSHHYDTPLGPATRNADSVREALQLLRDPDERIVHELMANIAQSACHRAGENFAYLWNASEHALGWSGQWPRP